MKGLAIAAALASAPMAPPAREACDDRALPVDAVELKEFPIDDLTLSANTDRFVAASVLAPATWTATGGLTWETGAPCAVEQRIEWRVQSPGGAASIAILPAEQWTASASPAQFSDCESRDLYSAQSFAEDILKRLTIRHDGLAVRDRSEIVDAYQRAPADDYEGSVSASAIEARFATGSESGRHDASVDGLIITAVVVSTPGSFIPEFERRAFSLPSVLALAPAGTLDRNLVEAVRASVLANPAWSAAAREIMNKGWTAPGHGAADLLSRHARGPFPVRVKADPFEACGAIHYTTGIVDVSQTADGLFYYRAPGAAVLGEGAKLQ